MNDKQTSRARQRSVKAERKSVRSFSFLILRFMLVVAQSATRDDCPIRDQLSCVGLHTGARSNWGWKHYHQVRKDTSLTSEQVQSVLKLARECGMSEPSEISIGRIRPTNRRLILVKGKERVSGRRSSYDQVYVYYSAWVQFRKDLKRNSARFLGEPALRGDFEFAEIQHLGKPIKVRMSQEISIAPPSESSLPLLRGKYSSMIRGTSHA